MTDITTRGEFQNNIDSLTDLQSYDFEQIFKMCYDSDKQAYFYNLLKTVNIPNKIDSTLYMTIPVPTRTSMTKLSHSIYGTMKLWWLICTVNNIDNPVKFIPGGTLIKVIRPKHVSYIIKLIKQSLVD